MLRETDKDRPAGANRKAYLRSVSWTDRSPTKPNRRPQPAGKARLCLPSLPPLSISRGSCEDWPKAGSDDLGIWPQAPTPGARDSDKQLEKNSNAQQPEREFQFKRDKLAFFDKECSRILDHVYLGSHAVAKNREILRQNGITHVLNCVGFVCPEYFKSELVYKTLWLQDSPSEDITSILYDVFDYFEDVREQGGRVLVHCCQGVSRSTSLVIAYLMWKDRKTFEDAFQYVKSARPVTNPNMGFACQLLLCQKRILAFLASPKSVLMMYRMAPHSPYDPLHLVPKLLSQPGVQGLDSRGAFVVHDPSAVFVWIGRQCISLMSDNARAAAFQVIRYKMARGPVVTIKEGEEIQEFWDVLTSRQLLTGDYGEVEGREEERLCVGNDMVSAPDYPVVGKRKVDEYDRDFGIFHQALAGGVVPPFPLSGTGPETGLPARESAWGRLRHKFASGIVKEFIASSKLSCDTAQLSHGSDLILGCKEVDQPVSPTDPQLPSSPNSCPTDHSPTSPISSLNRIKDVSKELEKSIPQTNPLWLPAASLSTQHSFLSDLVSSPKFVTKSPSLSPSTSDYSSSFTFSPSSSNWSDLSYLSSQSSPSWLESAGPYSANNTSFVENNCLICKGTFSSQVEACCSAIETKICLPCKRSSPFIAERQGSDPPPPMMLPSSDKASQVPPRLARSWSFSLPEIDNDVMRDVDCSQHDEVFCDLQWEETILGADNVIECRAEYDACYLPFSDATGNDAQSNLTELVLYQWPTLDKLEIHGAALLDSRFVYLTFMPRFVTANGDVLYIWVGREFSLERWQKQLTGNYGMLEDNHINWERVGCDFLKQRGLPLGSSVLIIKEGEEPEELLKLLN